MRKVQSLLTRLSSRKRQFFLTIAPAPVEAISVSTSTALNASQAISIKG